MIRRPPRSTLSSSSAASDVYKRQEGVGDLSSYGPAILTGIPVHHEVAERVLSLIHISEPTRLLSISYAVFCLKKKKKKNTKDTDYISPQIKTPNKQTKNTPR